MSRAKKLEVETRRNENLLRGKVVSGRAALEDGRPWYTPEAVEWLEEFLRTFPREERKVCEFGGGGSTAFFLRLCSMVLTAEHNVEWLPHIRELTIRLEVAEGLHVYYIPGTPDVVQPEKYRAYTRAFRFVPDKSLLVGAVDGEEHVRLWQFLELYPKVRDDGIIVVDNSDWIPEDLCKVHKLTRIRKRIDFIQKAEWPPDKKVFNWYTSVFLFEGANG
jgi:hypothetical protein